MKFFHKVTAFIHEKCLLTTFPVMPSKAALALRNSQCLQRLDLKELDGELTWEDLQKQVERVKHTELVNIPAAYYAVGKCFACPDYTSERGYYYCMVTAFCARRFKGAVTFTRPAAKRDRGHFTCFPKTFVSETVEFDGYLNALVPLPYAVARGRQVKILLPLSVQIRVYLKYGAGAGAVSIFPNANRDLSVLCKTAYAMKSSRVEAP